MYMRLAHARLKSDSLSDIKDVYDKILIPRFEKITGCLYLSIIVKEPQHDEGFSISLWDSLEHMEAYEQSGQYQENVEELRPYFMDSSEQKIQLSKDLKLEYVSVPEEPTVESYASLAETNSKTPDRGKAFLTNVRFVSVKIHPDKIEEFTRIYTDEIIPVLKSLKGCLYAFLIRGLEEKNSAISITFWESKTDMENYERSGIFDELNDKVKRLYTDLYRWKMDHEKDTDKKIVTSEDLTVNHFCLLTGKSFN